MKERASVVKKDLIQKGIGRNFVIVNARNYTGGRYFMSNLF